MEAKLNSRSKKSGGEPVLKNVTRVSRMRSSINSYITLTLFYSTLIGSIPSNKADDILGADEFSLSASNRVRLRGYLAEDHNVQTTRTHVINLVKIKNPLIANGNGKLATKKSILFIHGLFNSASYFVANSVDARPRDYSNISTANKTLAELNTMLAGDPSTSSLPLLLSNFGHDVWLMNRRPTLESQMASGQRKLSSFTRPQTLAIANHGAPFETLLGKIQENLLGDLKPFIESTLVDPVYWNFSVDDQALIDLPTVIDYIIKTDGRPQVSLVAHSLGGSAVLMMMSALPAYDMKVGKSVLYAPGFDFSDKSELFFLVSKSLEPIKRGYIGPVTPRVLAPVVQSIAASVCMNKLLMDTVCVSVMDEILGKGSNHLNFEPGFYDSILVPSGSHELAQQTQQFRDSLAHRMDLGSPALNMAAYGQNTAPFYPSKRINATKLSIWSGNTDFLVNPEDVKVLLRNIDTPAEVHFLGDPIHLYNHISYQYHKNVTTVVSIPSLKFLDS